MSWQREIEQVALQTLTICTSDYAARIWENIGNDVISDVVECSAICDEGYFSDGDVVLAIGRVLCNRLGIE